jgi:hypothetical protein
MCLGPCVIRSMFNDCAFGFSRGPRGKDNIQGIPRTNLRHQAVWLIAIPPLVVITDSDVISAQLRGDIKVLLRCQHDSGICLSANKLQSGQGQGWIQEEKGTS